MRDQSLTHITAREIFSTDEISNQLHNRYDGQGHRAQLAESLRHRHYDAHSEVLEARVGEERAMYVREWPGKGSHYAAAPSPCHVNQGQSTPRSINRACSPRSSGNVRFVHGQRVAGQPESTNLGTNAIPAVGVLERSQDNDTIIYKAEYWAANPGSKCDEYHQKHPDRREYLRNAQRKLIKNAFAFATKPDSPDTVSYYSQHPMQKWIFEKALLAIDLVENKTEAEVEAYYASHPNDQDFRGCAKANLKPKRHRNAIAYVSAKLPPATTTPGPPLSPEMGKCTAAPVSASKDVTPAAIDTPKKLTPWVEKRIESGSTETKNLAPATNPCLAPVPSTLDMPPIEPSSIGSLDFRFLDFLGNLVLQVKQAVAAPVACDIQLEALEVGFDIRDIVRNCHVLAETISRLRNSDACEVSSIPGWRMAEDGVWEED